MGAASDISRSRGARAVGVTARTAHICAMGILVGGLYFAVPEHPLRLWQTLTALTGVVLMVSEASHSRHWIYQGRGLITLAHVAAPALLLSAGGVGRTAALAALVIGSVGSHLPRSLRKWSLRHRSAVD